MTNVNECLVTRRQTLHSIGQGVTVRLMFWEEQSAALNWGRHGELERLTRINAVAQLAADEAVATPSKHDLQGFHDSWLPGDHSPEISHKREDAGARLCRAPSHLPRGVLKVSDGNLAILDMY